MYDLIIVGGGPAGLTAAIYARRAGKSVLIIERSAFGGQMTYSPKIENYPGYASASGNQIADAMVEQALGQGADIELDNVTGINENADGTKTVKGDNGEYTARAVIISVGCRHRHMGIEREEEFIGEGISFCAVCDGAFYKDKTVVMIGGGNSALQEALMLSEGCKKLTIVQNLMFLTGEAKLVEQVKEKKNIEVLYGYVADSIIGDDVLRGIRVRNDRGEKIELYADGVFVAIGLQPENEAFRNIARLDDFGYFDSDENCITGTDGVFVAGDCRAKRVRQITTATADGAVAALAACRYLDRYK
jgi:thioredoxin reductase (NADPH)